MTVTEQNSDFALPGAHVSDLRLPSIAQEPALERLLGALHSAGMVFLLRASSRVCADWLTHSCIDRHLRQALMEPAQTDIWPLLPGAWAISLHVEGDPDQPVTALHIHALRRILAERLEAEFQESQFQEAALAGDSLVDSPFAPTDTQRAITNFQLTPVASLRAMDDREDNLSELNALLHIIINKQLHAQFQPIVSLRDGQIFGYEALIRGPKGSPLRRSGAMFRVAHKARMVSWYDLACQEQCFALAVQQGLRHPLFINMEAEGLAFVDMHDRPLAARARDYGLNPANIVIEITERQAVEDFPRLMHALARLREQGFKIAIDDAGAGYNSLAIIAELRPDFVKVDRALVRNLDVHGERRALLAALVAFARNLGAHVLAEGAETQEELATLIDLGVTYGQGYLMGKPADTFRGVTRETREFIQARYRQHAQMLAGREVTVGGLARAGKALPSDAPLAEAARGFYKNPSQTSVAVVEEGFVRGLLMRQSLEHILDVVRSAHMNDLLPNETVSQWMTTNLLRVGQEARLGDVARQATMRSDLSLESDILIVDGSDHYVGVLPMRVLMEAATALQENRQHYADPLTGLPNRIVLEQIVEERLDARAPLALARIDLTGLAGYNRAYSLPHGDAVIHALVCLIQEASTASSAGITTSEAMPFVAHLGGDDFVVLLHPQSATEFCAMLTQGFACRLPFFYSPEHFRSGGMQTVERNGSGMRRVPLLACTVAVVTTLSRKFTRVEQMLEDAHTLLRQVKAQPSLMFAIDRLPTNNQRKAA